MRSRRVSVILVSVVFVLAGCGVQPSPVLRGGHAPTGIASGTPVYYVNASGELVVRRSGDTLGTIGEALKLLLSPRSVSGAHSYVGSSGVTLAFPITKSRDLITVGLPIGRAAVVRPPLGINQIVCTVLAVHQQSGGSPETRVRLDFVRGDSTEPRYCPVLPKG